MRSLLRKHQWFMRESWRYLGHDDFVAARRAKWPMARAWVRFMWSMRHDTWSESK